MAGTSLSNSLADILPDMLRFAGVQRVTVERINRPPSFRGSTVSERAQVITESARSQHHAHGFGFWEFALKHSLDADPDTRRALIRGSLNHAPDNPGRRYTLTVETLADNLTSGTWQGLPARSMVNLCSTVYTSNGQTGHLLLLDFGIPHTGESSVAAAFDVLDALRLSGSLFASGRSFHFVSAEVVTSREMRQVLARAQLLSPLIDARWVSHQLIDDECRLRISTDVERNTKPHQLVRNGNCS